MKIDEAISYLQELKKDGSENIVFEAWPKGFFGVFTENITEEAWETISNILMYELDWTKINEDMLELVEDAKEKYNKEREYMMSTNPTQDKVPASETYTIEPLKAPSEAYLHNTY